MENIRIKDEYIKLGQAMKLAGIVSEGVEAKFMIEDGIVKVNGEVCTMRGKKLYENDIFDVNGITVKVTK